MNDDLTKQVTEWKSTLWETADGAGMAFLRGRGLSDEYIDRYDLGWVDGGWYGGCVSIPIYDGLIRPRTARFRRVEAREGRPKYDQYKGEVAHLFNVSSVRHHTVYIAEGEFDAIVLEQSGRSAVGVPGKDNFQEAWKWLFAGNDVRIVFDRDADEATARAVRKATRQIARWLEPIADQVIAIDLPTGMDISDFYQSDPEGLEELLSSYDRD